MCTCGEERGSRAKSGAGTLRGDVERWEGEYAEADDAEDANEQMMSTTQTMQTVQTIHTKKQRRWPKSGTPIRKMLMKLGEVKILRMPRMLRRVRVKMKMM